LLLGHLPLEKNKHRDQVLAIKALAVNLLESCEVDLGDLALLLLGLDRISVEKASLRFSRIA
jgi:hypothetical protein